MKFMFGLQHPLTCKPWTTLSNPCNKVRGKYICKEVFLCLPSCIFITSCVCFIIVSLWCCRWLYNNMEYPFPGPHRSEMTAPDWVLLISWIELFDHFNCVQTSDKIVRNRTREPFNCVKNKWPMFNLIASDTLQYLEPFNYVQIKLLV